MHLTAGKYTVSLCKIKLCVLKVSSFKKKNFRCRFGIMLLTRVTHFSLDLNQNFTDLKSSEKKHVLVYF